MLRAVRRAVLGGLLVGSITLIPATAASAHVHGITPLLKCSVDADNSGAAQTDLTPASSQISGVIPISRGAPLVAGESGGATAPVQCP